jgi:hypothetical protein
MCIVTGNAMDLHEVLSSFLFNFFGHLIFFPFDFFPLYFRIGVCYLLCLACYLLHVMVRNRINP